MEFSQGLISAAYIVAALLFIFSLSGLSKQETAETGNWYGIIGMSIALIATIADPRVDNVLVIFVAMSVGARPARPHPDRQFFRRQLPVDQCNFPDRVHFHGS